MQEVFARQPVADRRVERGGQGFRSDRACNVDQCPSGREHWEPVLGAAVDQRDLARGVDHVADASHVAIPRCGDVKRRPEFEAVEAPDGSGGDVADPARLPDVGDEFGKRVEMTMWQCEV